ncbi:MAG TPA: molybdenum cofactor biosynthesis protein [Firmicutes bacterium]|nr:molybdenum cofactor biosynthesis protein [Bacillota bacterium]
MRVVAVCTSKHKGDRKKDIGEGRLIKDLGLEGDAHAGFAHRQISLLAMESIRKMKDKGLTVGPGDFAENLTVEGIDLPALPIGARLRVGQEAVLQVTQIGKECHGHCSIYRLAGDCVMPREGIFTRVLRGGMVHNGDEIKIIPNYRIGVITASDQGARGQRQDQSGPLVKELLLPWGDVTEYEILPDEQSVLAQRMKDLADGEKVDLLLTTGGTGLGPRDRTPEATMEVVERLIPGIPEAMRAAGSKKTMKAILSRGVAGIRGRTLIINLPGSPRGVRENLEVIFPVLEHGLELVTGCGGECGHNEEVCVNS